jgi:hypothetical protein
MRVLWLVIAIVVGAVWLPATVQAENAVIETTRQIQGGVSEDSLRAALRMALQTAAAGAAAMGLPFIVVDAAYVLPDGVTVRVLATDQPPAGDEEEPRRTPGAKEEALRDLENAPKRITRPTF